MQISNQALLTEMNAMAIEAGSPAGAITPTVNAGSDFGDLLTDAIKNVNRIQKHSGEMATRFEMGDPAVSLSDTMIAKEKAGVAFEATVQVRNKIVEAYKEIMSMPV